MPGERGLLGALACDGPNGSPDPPSRVAAEGAPTLRHTLGGCTPRVPRSVERWLAAQTAPTPPEASGARRGSWGRAATESETGRPRCTRCGSGADPTRPALS